MVETIVLDEVTIMNCFFCGKKRPADRQGMYEYYCSDDCETKDHERIFKMLDEGEHPHKILEGALRKVSGGK